MYIFEITKPGTWLDYDDREWSYKIVKILTSLEKQFYEANLALNMFNRAKEQWEASRLQYDEMEQCESYKADSRRRSEIRQEIESKLENPHAHSSLDEIDLQTEIQFKREQWHSGRMPSVFGDNEQASMHARAFLYALDSFGKFFEVLKDSPGIPEQITELHKRLGEAFPDLREVRNTSQHMEDRSRGLGKGRNPKPLELKPIDNFLYHIGKADGSSALKNGITMTGTIISSSQGFMALNCLIGTEYGNTMADGNYGKVDVSPESMVSLREIFQETLDSFNWIGSKSHLPS